MYEEIFSKIGLSSNEARVYELLLQVGPSGVQAVVHHTGLARGSAYFVLESLEKKGIVSVNKDGTKQVFSALSPANLELLLSEHKKKLLLAETEFKSLLPSLQQLFQTATFRPGVRFYEGVDGIKTVLEDTLIGNPEKKLATFSDLEGYVALLGEWNKTYYAPKRKKLGVFERAIVPSTPTARKYIEGYVAGNLTENRLIDAERFPFKTEVNIYSNKVSFVSFNKKLPVAVLIENPEVCETLLSVFELVWKSTN